VKKHRAKIKEVAEGQFGFDLTFAPPIGEASIVTLNSTSLEKICEAYGRNEKKWTGKPITLEVTEIGSFIGILVSPGK
jgi:hypothetical protein